jgi:hypothetical protein
MRWLIALARQSYLLCLEVRLAERFPQVIQLSSFDRYLLVRLTKY